MKRLILIFTFLITFVCTNLAANAANNHLHTITLEKNNTGYNIILGSDKLAKVTKKTPTDNEIELDLKGITSSDTVNALYKGTNNIDGLVIENAGNNKLKIHINAENIKNSTIMMEPIDGAPSIVGETVPVEKILWTIFVLSLFAVILKISKDISEEDEKVLIKKDIKDREIELYKKYRSEVLTNNLLDNKDLKMRNIVKKIDRKIDERLTSVIK